MNIIETNLKFKELTKRTKTEQYILHHTGCSQATPEQIHQWHLNNGWSGAGYQLYVRKDGTIYLLRPLDCVGAHAYGSNSNSVGICCEGNFEVEQMTDEQVKSVSWLLNTYLKEKYGKLPVKKHKDVCATSCPGKNYRFDEVANISIETPVIVVDEKKERIKELQSLLNKVYGSGLAVDGIIGKHTNNALRKVALKNYCTNELVKFVQRRLIMNGRSVGNCGADGKYGKDTEKAVRKFQTEKGLTVDGIAGINTIKALI